VTRANHRRWDLTEEELLRVDEARSVRLNAREATRLVVRSPRLLRDLMPEALRVARTTGRQLAWSDLAIGSLVHAERARQAVPDAASGVGWSPEEPLIDALNRFAEPAMTALELGAGAGRVTRHLAQRVGEVVCTDVSPAMVAEARANLSEFGNVRCALSDGFTLREFADDSFDLVLAAGVLTFFTPNALLAMLDEVARVVRPGGVCIANYMLLDDPQDARSHLEHVRRDARERRFLLVEQGYVYAELAALHRLAGIPLVEPASAAELTATAGRPVLIGRVAPGEGDA
jgi:SAM-dependent methyltransferase